MSGAAAGASAVAAAIAGGVSLRGSETTRTLALVKKQLNDMDAQFVATLLGQAQDLAERDVAGALQAMKQLTDILLVAVSTATADAAKLAKAASATIATRSLPGVVVRPLIQSDMVTLGQALLRLENALARQVMTAAAGRALQRARVTFDRNVGIVAFKSTTVPLVLLK